MQLHTTLSKKLELARQGGANHLLVAFSGGLDSTVLLHLCSLYRNQYPDIKLTATHIHHGLSPNADKWANHCQSVCESWQVEFSLCKVDVPQGARISLEASAREQRYTTLHSQLSEQSLLLTAHHQDDQVETLLLALKRGSGLDGLSAMPETMPLERGTHLRPLLAHSRIDLEAYAKQAGLSWIEDESNQDEIFDRNFIRHSLLPLLQERWPGFSKAAARSVSLLGEQRRIVDELATQDLATARHAQGVAVHALEKITPERRNNLLRLWLREQGAPLWSQAQQEQAWNSVAQSKEDAQPKLSWQGWELLRYQGVLYLKKEQPVALPEQLSWRWPEPLQLPDGFGTLNVVKEAQDELIRLPKADEEISVRFAAPGSLRVHPSGRSGSRPLKKVWQELNVPPWLRPQIPLIFYNQRCVAAVGYWVDKAFVAGAEEGWVPVLER